MKEIEERVRAIGGDNVSGARELADRAAELLFDLLRSQKRGSKEKLITEVAALSNRLLDLQPSIGPLFNLTNGLLLLLDTPNPDFHPVEAGKEWLALFRGKLSRNVEHLRRRTLDLLPDKGTVMTYSYSSTVVETLIAAKKLGKSLRVYCSEGRPNLEGRRLARELSQAGISVRFGVDAALFGWMEETDLLLVGGDAVSRRGLLNKIGTSALVLCARSTQKRVPRKKEIKIYALADTGKLIPTGLADRLRVVSRDLSEVWGSSISSLEVINRYFDLTPLEWLHGVVTEDGLESSSTLLERADVAPVSKRLVPGPKRTAGNQSVTKRLSKENRMTI